MATTAENKILKAALENIDAVAAKLKTKIEAAVQKAEDTYPDIDSAVSELKYQIENQVIKLGSMEIPAEVYQKFGESVYEKINGTSELENYSSDDDDSIKKIWKKIANAISDIPDTNVAVNVTDENGNTRTVNYSINFVWSFSLFGLSVVRAKISNDTDSVNVIFTDNLQETLVEFCATLKQLDNKLMDKVWTKVSEVFLSDEDQAVAKDLIDVIYSDASPTSKLKKVLGSTLLKNIDKEEIKSKINELLGTDSDKQLAASYETLNNLYNEMKDLISAGQDVTDARADFISISQSVLESDFVAIPDPANDIQYSKNSTEITIPATFGNTISAADYNSKVKKIDATAFSSGVNLSGNANANIIYGGSGSDIIYGGKGNDTIYGGSGADSLFGDAGNDKIFGDAGNDTLSGGAGNDTLTGGDGADIFFYASGDGNDVITDYKAGEDFIKIGSGTVSNYSVKGGNDAILTIGKGKITLKGVGNDAISVVTADNETVTYGGIAEGLNYNKNDLSKSTAVTITSDYDGKTYEADYSTLVTLDAASRNNSIELTGNAKANKIYGGSGKDTLYGETGNDSIYGGNGADKLFGGAGNDKLFGENGNDTLSGGTGKDTLTGGAGKDVFYYAKGDGADVITDYAAGDKIYIDGANSVSGSLKNNDVTFKIGSGSIKLQQAKNIEVTINFSNGTQGKYLNGKLISSETAEIFADNNFANANTIDSLLDNNSVGEVSFDDSDNPLAQDNLILSCNNKNIDTDSN